MGTSYYLFTKFNSNLRRDLDASINTVVTSKNIYTLTSNFGHHTSDANKKYIQIKNVEDWHCLMHSGDCVSGLRFCLRSKADNC